MSFGLDARHLERALGRLEGEIARALTFSGEVTLADAGALEDPLVRRVHDARERRVRDGLTRDVVAGADDFETHRSTEIVPRCGLSRLFPAVDARDCDGIR